MRVGVSLALGAQRVPAGGGSTPEWPATVTADALVLYDALATPPSVSGANVTTWADRSPNGRTLTPTGATPATYSATGIGTGPAVLCGTGLVTASITLTAATKLTVIAVQRAGGDLKNTLRFLTGSYYGLTLHRDATWRWCGDGDSGGSYTRGTASTADEYVVSAIGTAASRIYRRNGASALSSSSNGAPNYAGSGALNVATTAGGRAGIAALGLLCVLPRELTAEELAAVEAYCAAGWGL